MLCTALHCPRGEVTAEEGLNKLYEKGNDGAPRADNFLNMRRRRLHRRQRAALNRGRLLRACDIKRYS